MVKRGVVRCSSVGVNLRTCTSNGGPARKAKIGLGDGFRVGKSS
jgi:hypothetical protein